MKRLLIVPILVLAMAALAPVAYADHPGAQGPDQSENQDECDIAFVGHGTCTATSPTPDGPSMWAERIGGVPTADGWHVVFDYKMLDNDAATVIASGTLDRTVPYTTTFGPVPVPNSPTYGLQTGPGGSVTTTSTTCLVDVVVGSGGLLHCWYHV